MLSSEEIEKITEEELLRYEIRKSFEKKQPAKNKFFTFFNSALGIWLLSSIVIGVFTYTFNSYNEKRKSVKEREAKIKRIDTEVEARLAQFWANIDTLTSLDSSNEKDSFSLAVEEIDKLELRRVWNILKLPPSFDQNNSIFIYEEFKNRPISSLLYEEMDLLKDKYNIREYDSAKKLTELEQKRRSELYAIKHAADFIQGDWIFHIPKRTLWEIWQSFKRNLLFGRWHVVFRY